MKSNGPNDNQVIEKPIVFFDGVCGLCNRSVDWLLVRDKTRNALLFAPLQGETAGKMLPEHLVTSLSSIIVWSQGKVLVKTEAIIAICRHLSWPYPWLGNLLCSLPLAFRNRMYDRLAARRYRWFGKKETCRIPKPEERLKFLP